MIRLPRNKDTTIHHVLAHSYLVFFTAIVLGLIFQAILNIKFTHPFLIPVGFILLCLGTLLVLWAQQTSRENPKIRQMKGSLEHTDFFRGPYKFVRSPTHIGLTLLILGLALVLGSVVLVIAVGIAFIVSRYVFVYREEEMLVEKYGEAYESYKKKIKF